MARNQFLFDESTIAAKPKWLQRQLAGLLGTIAPVGRTSLPQPEPSAQPASDESAQIEALYSGRVLVRITSHRCGTLCDPDNIMPKWFIDALRYARIISQDTTREIALEIAPEVRVRTKKDEGTLIEIVPLP